MLTNKKPEEPLSSVVNRLFTYKDGHLVRRECTNKKQVIGERIGWTDKDGYIRVEISGVSYGEHRLIWLYFKGYLPMELDHIDGIRDNNYISNLRECTHVENMYNKASHNSTGVRGVTLTEGGRYRARITVAGRQLNLGTHDDKELAEFVVSEARDKYHKEFAYVR